MENKIKETIKVLSGEIEKYVDTFEESGIDMLIDYMVVMRHCLGFENKSILKVAIDTTRDFNNELREFETLDEHDVFMAIDNGYMEQIEAIDILLNAIEDLYKISDFKKPLSQKVRGM